MMSANAPIRPSRRRFLQTSAAGMAVPSIIQASALGSETKPAASDRISLGIIGVNGMGRSNLDNCARYPDVEVTAICDVWPERLDGALAKYGRTAGGMMTIENCWSGTTSMP